ASRSSTSRFAAAGTTGGPLPVPAVLREALFQLDWASLPLRPDALAAEPAGGWAVLGSTGIGTATRYADLAELGAAVDAGLPVPAYVLAPFPRQSDAL
ncbi:hypothetical protein PL81_03155, partial [Streptomyces sp. RSD-27]